MVCVRPVLAILLADHAVVGIAGRDQPAKRGLGLLIGLGDGVERARAALVELRIVAPEIGQ